MKTNIFTVIATTVAIAAAPAAFATKGNASKAAAEVAFSEPENFADFRMSHFYSDSDAEVLQKELSRQIERSAGAYLPPGARLSIRFTDIDLAGDINPFHNTRLNDVRIYKSVYIPRMTFDYAVTDAAGTILASGNERLVDMAYDMRLRMPGREYTRIEADMLRDFISDLGRQISKGQG